jgi:hypothetical protein
MPKALDVLLIEQEAYFDHVFAVMAKDILAVLVEPLDLKAIMAQLNANIDAVFGLSRLDALNSLVGRTILTYADSAYKEAMKRALTLMVEIEGEAGVSQRMTAGTLNDQQLTTVLDMLTPALIVAAANGLPSADRLTYWEDQLRSKYARILAGHDGGSNTTIDMFVGWYPIAVRLMEEVVRSGVAGRLPSQEMDAGKLVWASPGLLSAYIQRPTPVPLVLNDTSRWEVAGLVLADRIYLAGQTIRSRIERLVKVSIARKDKAVSLKRALTVYLTAKYKPERAAGQPTDAMAPGALARIGKGQASWPVRLLGRNELNRAYGFASLAAASANKDADCIQWQLAPSHVQIDDCDDAAEGSSPGLPRGVYRWNDVPFHPSHPGCLCELLQCTAEGV